MAVDYETKDFKFKGKLMTLNLKWRKIRDDIGI